MIMKLLSMFMISIILLSFISILALIFKAPKNKNSHYFIFSIVFSILLTAIALTSEPSNFYISRSIVIFMFPLILISNILYFKCKKKILASILLALSIIISLLILVF
ncbi:MAG: hypothetical protein ACRC41_09030 [Sarcina sp.]